jgi:hypothetical protein
MNYEDSQTPSVKGSFEYKPGKTHIFEPDKIGEYSSKIANVCKYIYGSTNSKSPSEPPRISDGIILIYSSYIDAGLIPMALALEEMGLTRYNGKSLFKTLPKAALSKDNKLRSAKYIMITGDPRLSPNKRPNSQGPVEPSTTEHQQPPPIDPHPMSPACHSPSSPVISCCC